MQRNQYALTSGSEYTLDKDCEEEMKTFLGMQQKAMEVLTDTVTKDLKALQIIIDGMPELVRGWLVFSWNRLCLSVFMWFNFCMQQVFIINITRKNWEIMGKVSKTNTKTAISTCS